MLRRGREGHACTLTTICQGHKLFLVCQDDGGSANMFAEVTLSWATESESEFCSVQMLLYRDLKQARAS